MRIDVDSEEEVLREIHERQSRPWKSLIEPVHVVSVNEQPLRIPLYIRIQEGREADLIISWAIRGEDSSAKSIRRSRLPEKGGEYSHFRGQVDRWREIYQGILD